MPCAVAMLQPRAVKLTGAKQGAQRATRVGFHLEQGTTVRARGTCVEKCDVSCFQKSLALIAHALVWQRPPVCHDVGYPLEPSGVIAADVHNPTRRDQCALPAIYA